MDPNKISSYYNKQQPNMNKKKARGMNFQADTKMKARKGNNNDQIKFGRQKQRAASYIGDK